MISLINKCLKFILSIWHKARRWWNVRLNHSRIGTGVITIILIFIVFSVIVVLFLLGGLFLSWLWRAATAFARWFLSGRTIFLERALWTAPSTLGCWARIGLRLFLFGWRGRTLFCLSKKVKKSYFRHLNHIKLRIVLFTFKSLVPAGLPRFLVSTTSVSDILPPIACL